MLQEPIRVMRIIARMNVGGPAVQISGLMRGLNPNIFQQKLFTGHCAPDEADYIKTVATDISVVRIEGLGRKVNITHDMRAFFELIHEIRKFEPHIIHTHTAKAGFIGRLASIFSSNNPILVHTYHGHLLTGYFNHRITKILILTEKILGYLSTQLLAVGENVKLDLLNAGIGHPNKFSVMSPGITIGILPEKYLARRKFGLSEDSVYCALIGRLTKIKRPDRFLDVVGEIKRRGIDLKFFVAGDGELLTECRTRVAKEELPVEFLGWETDIEAVLAATDIVLLTSDNEGTPISLIQAGMAGVPSVSTNVGSVSEILIDMETGLLTSLNPSDIADALTKLFENIALRSSLGSNAKRFTKENFTSSRLVLDHENLYKTLIANQAKF